MSLFGESPPPTPVAARQNKSSLFDDDNEQPAARSTSANSGLFAESNDRDDNHSPWDFAAPNKRQRAQVIKTLLPASDVPEPYVDLFDALLSQSSGQGGVTVRQIKSLLSTSSIGQPEQTKILDLIGAFEGDDSRVLGRGEVNVVLALIGLAQEGEELGLDAVDERRKQLPVPNLPSLTKQEQKPPRAPTGPPSQAASGAAQAQNIETPGFGFGDDPWASPELHKNHHHDAAPASYAQAAAATPSYPNGSVNGRAEPPHVRTTSNFTTTSTTDPTDVHTPDASFEPARPVTSEGGWGGYSAPNDGFNAAPGNDGFGDSQVGEAESTNHLSRSLGASTRIGGTTGPEELVTVNLLEEKEGMFMFQHRNYEVSSIRRNSRVIRRYSDFVWLLDCLHKKFPFRQLPLLPPKRVASKCLRLIIQKFVC
jgi:sorting nexin-8